MAVEASRQFSSVTSDPDEAQVASNIYNRRVNIHGDSPKDAWKAASSNIRYYQMADNWTPGTGQKEASRIARRKRAKTL
jgi:hypothetical protein